MTTHDLLPVTRCCVAAGVMTQKEILLFKLVYLRCAFHRELWRCADKRAKQDER